MNLTEIVFWHWWVLALLLVVFEALAPGFIFIWMAAAAGVVGFVLLADPALSWEWQLLIFSALSVLAIAIWRFLARGMPESQTDQPSLNRRGEQYLGKRYALAEPIVNGIGKVRIGDTLWRVSGADAAAGANVEVVGVDGATLLVESDVDEPTA